VDYSLLKTTFLRIFRNILTGRFRKVCTWNLQIAFNLGESDFSLSHLGVDESGSTSLLASRFSEIQIFRLGIFLTLPISLYLSFPLPLS
jgi:hypothetical protein